MAYIDKCLDETGNITFYTTIINISNYHNPNYINNKPKIFSTVQNK